jgi:hypothetical protein
MSKKPDRQQRRRDVKSLLDKIERLPADQQSRIYRLIYLPVRRSTSVTTEE